MNIKLNFITKDSCPDCSARWVTAGVETDSGGYVRSHVHGGEWEFIKYACGRVDKYIPNFQSVQNQMPCSNSPKVVAEKQRKREAHKALTAAIGKADLTQSERERIESNIRSALDMIEYDAQPFVDLRGGRK